MDVHLNEDYEQKYTKLKLIGIGNYTNVYSAENKITKELRALKVFRLDEIELLLKKEEDSVDINDFINNIKNEIKNMKICQENNIYSVKYYESFQTKKTFAIVLELCDKSLRKDIKYKKKFNCQEIFEILNHLNNSFRIMKEKEIVHRDLKPDNILIKIEKEKPITKLCDYGISKIGKFDNLTSCNKGTRGYMSPEILEGEGKTYNFKCDLWSLGITIYELYFHKRPFEGETDIAILKSIELKEKHLEKTHN